MWDWVYSVLPTDIRSFLWGLIPTGSLLALYVRKRDHNRIAAARADLSIRKRSGDKGVRSGTLKLRSWEEADIQSEEFRFMWPLSAKGAVLVTQEEMWGTAQPTEFRRRVRVRKTLPARNGEPRTFGIQVKVHPFIAALLIGPLRRCHLKVVGKVLDARRGRTRLNVRSDTIDWRD